MRDTREVTWHLQHSFVNDRCTKGQPNRRKGRFSRPSRRQESCPQAGDSDVAARLTSAITAMLARQGIVYEPGGETRVLWCLGGQELYRDPAEVDHDDPEMCLDLNLTVCDEHQTISLRLESYDLVPEWGGTGPDDPRRSEPIPLDDDRDVVDQIGDRLEPWLDEILILPNGSPCS